ncbi:NAD(P)/FAD-dependent oxidoreductase [Streptomyces turgidiscabies]|uniref:Glycine/D-amino acid oxidase-like deaminating enzyme n=1 Tax=Streptomyces turgidiscabies TaxID=85558 RepID=A0ABU0RF88_9ACTN|nr:FAD-binding oxidoreductase [Streptomyces turgidiscabies]MDQ0930649.1 glycine/D-amino acid oxidase-like deaminating enzyme [Streptomyces turgidiscabies]
MGERHSPDDLFDVPVALAPPWRGGRPEDHQLPSVQGLLSADFTVVGAGLAGLSTAYHLLRYAPGADVAVVDAGHPATGASGHGTGLLGPRAGPPVDRALRRHGPDAARRMHRASEDAVAGALELCRVLDVPVRTGEQLVVARSPEGLARLSEQATAYRALGLDVPSLSAAGVRERIDVPCQAGLLHRHAATLDPALLTAALARACAAGGARLYGRSPVVGHHATGSGGTRLLFPRGELRTRAGVFAVNGGADALGLPVGTVAPLEVHAIATEPLKRAVRTALGEASGASWVDAARLAPYFRLTPEGRLVLGGGRASLPGAPGGAGERRDDRARRATWQWLAERMRALHPLLADTAVTHRWTGRIGVTLDDLPVVGPLAPSPGMWFVGGCCGHGLALSVAHGAYVARQLVGAGARDVDGGPGLPWHRSAAPRLPFGGAGRVVLRRHLDRLDRRVRSAV